MSHGEVLGMSEQQFLQRKQQSNQINIHFA